MGDVLEKHAEFGPLDDSLPSPVGREQFDLYFPAILGGLLASSDIVRLNRSGKLQKPTNLKLLRIQELAMSITAEAMENVDSVFRLVTHTQRRVEMDDEEQKEMADAGE